MRGEKTMKRKTVLATSVAAIAAVTLLGGTLAWFTQEGEKVNKLQTGNLHVTLNEEYTENDYKNVVPGDYVAKKPIFTNDGSIDARLQYRVVVTCPLSEATDVAHTTDPTQAIQFGFGDGKSEKFDPINLTLEKKTADDGAITYESAWTDLDSDDEGNILAKGETATAFDHVYFVGDKIFNDFEAQNLEIKVEYRALQADNTKDVDMEKVSYEKEDNHGQQQPVAPAPAQDETQPTNPVEGEGQN
jgi:predicted ribosomally synthesized peptide with SipW-like signal peptide